MLRTLFLTAALGISSAFAAEQPNVIFILCDDLGWGDLGISYQNERDTELKHATPKLDQMAREGAQLRAHYCPAPVCAPSRASLFTGLHQGHATIRDNQFDKALPDDHNLASTLKAAGYQTALVGKYGLQGKQGDSPEEWPAYPTKRGFDDFFGYVRHVDGHLHYPAHHWELGHDETHRTPKEVWHNEKEISKQLSKCFTSDLFTAYAKKWIIEQSKESSEAPFFLCLAYDTPHAALQLPPCPYPEGGGLKGGVQWLGQEDKMINTATGEIDSYVHPDHQEWSDLAQRQGGMIRRIDDHIGDLTQLLRDLGIAENTLIVFSSDNGPHKESYLQGGNYQASLFQAYGPYDGIKRDTLEGGIRVPTLAWWPETIPAGRVVGGHSQFHDWLNTFLEMAGAPLLAQSDGVSLLPLLTGKGEQTPPVTYVEYSQNQNSPRYKDFTPSNRGHKRGQMQVIFLDGYKGLRRNIKSADDDFEIYDVTTDTHEANNLAGTSDKFTRLQQKMKDTVLQLRRPNSSAKRPYDKAPVPAIADAETSDGLKVRHLRGEFPWVPAFQQAKSSAAEGAPSGETAAAVEQHGYLEVAMDGKYTFEVEAPDALVLKLHRILLIDGDSPASDGGPHKATIKLKEGLHPISLSYLTKGSEAKLSITGPGETRLCH
ncbi:MAG: sulfatase-like hydrolase/transferase [Verrucomicrobiota bacterium JB023]|nr:sulfatase-like hydrolase/transferase [Verrucomicrobiota bacterium JB023]